MRYEYGKAGQLTAEEDAFGNRKEYTYNGNGQMADACICGRNNFVMDKTRAGRDGRMQRQLCRLLFLKQQTDMQKTLLNGERQKHPGKVIMWENIKTDDVGAIEKCVAEFRVWVTDILPCGKMKIKIYKDKKGFLTGYTDVQVIRKFDNSPEGAVGFGKTVEETLADTINYFLEIVKSDYPKDQYPHGVPEENIEYTDYSDF